MAGDYHEVAIWRESYTLDWVLPVEVKEFQAVQLEIVAVVIEKLEYLEYAVFIADGQILSIR